MLLIIAQYKVVVTIEFDDEILLVIDYEHSLIFVSDSKASETCDRVSLLLAGNSFACSCVSAVRFTIPKKIRYNS